MGKITKRDGRKKVDMEKNRNQSRENEGKTRKNKENM
jgi:hypothetical protein